MGEKVLPNDLSHKNAESNIFIEKWSCAYGV